MTNRRYILADAHVHIYNCFNYSKFFDSSLNNFLYAAKQKRMYSATQNVLLLAESSGYNKFDFLTQIAREEKYLEDVWFFRETLEDCALRLEKKQQQQQQQNLFLFAGSQIVTYEKLEVLALLCKTRIPDGLTLKETIDQVTRNGGLPVIPWGFGKWIGHRGEILNHFLSKTNPNEVFLGDNSGRPSFWKNSPIFAKAQKSGIKILPGTDPLPFPQQAKRPGSYGFLLEGFLDNDQPAKSFKHALLSTQTQPISYGSLEKPLVFLQNQIKMQTLKRIRK